jgi:hypothetical protein
MKDKLSMLWNHYANEFLGSIAILLFFRVFV